MNTIYVITCLVNQKKYVGQTWNRLAKRFSDHKSDARRHAGTSIKLYNAIRKYGDTNFIIEKIDEASTQNEANNLERYYISLYDSIHCGYNIREGGSNGRISSDTKKKLSKILRDYVNLGEASSSSKLINKDIPHILKLSSWGLSNRKIAKIMKVHHNTIGDVLSGRSWTHITGMKRDRKKTKPQKGSNHSGAILNEKKVRQIRKDRLNGDTYSILSKRYGVAIPTIADIIRLRIWKHVAP